MVTDLWRIIRFVHYSSVVRALIAFSALTLLVGCQEGQLACKNWVMRCCCGYLPRAGCRLCAYGPADATAIPKPHNLLPHLHPGCSYLFWYWLAWLGGRIVSVLDSGAEGPGFRSGNSLRQTVHTHCAVVHQSVKLVSALLRVARVTAGLAESNGSLPPVLWLTPPTGWLPRTSISSGTLRSAIEWATFPFFLPTYPGCPGKEAVKQV